MRPLRQDTEITPKQSAILRFIAENGPCSIRAAEKEVGMNYSNVHAIIRKLSGLRYVEQVPGSGWWISFRGLMPAIDFGADPIRILGKTKEFYLTEQTTTMKRICEYAIAHKKQWKEYTTRETLMVKFIEAIEYVIELSNILQRAGSKPVEIAPGEFVIRGSIQTADEWIKKDRARVLRVRQ